MANAIYPRAKQALLTGAINWVGNTIHAIAVDTAQYTVDLNTHEFLSSIPGAARIASGALSNKTATSGVADADNVTFSSVVGATIEAVVLAQISGSDATSRLIAYIDEGSTFPVTPNGNDITVIWSDSASKIFRIN